jgi:hypothetical protein
MNTQNILRFYGSKLDLKLDSSEFYDYELGKNDIDYNTDVLDLSKEISYTGLTINTSLTNFDCDRETITLREYDNRVNDNTYIYSGITVTVDYDLFVSHFGTGYTHTILNNNIFSLTTWDDNTHYFEIYRFNEPLRSPIGAFHGGLSTINDNSLIITEDDELLEFINEFDLEVRVNQNILDISDDSNIIDTNDNNLIVVSDPLTYGTIIDEFDSDFIDCIQSLDDDDNCCLQPLKLYNKPWAYKFDSGAGVDNCSPIIKRRTEKGWTLDFIFNRQNQSWSSGGVFYYLGVRGENNPLNYSDNNLSFQFTSDRRIKWVSHHYSGVCDPTNGYSDGFYIASGQTPQLCVTQPTKDFNITISFDRYKRYTDCNLENDGGWNDLITGRTLNTSIYDWLTGSTPNYTDLEVLNREWNKERERRLGILKIYLNGRPIYKIEDWEEIIPSDRGEQPYIQSWGGGTGLMNGIHNGVSCFNIKSIKYYEEPLDFVHVRHNFITRLNNYNFEICGDDCVDDITALVTPTPTPTITPTPTPTPTITPTPTPTPTPNG